MKLGALLMMREEIIYAVTFHPNENEWNERARIGINLLSETSDRIEVALTIAG